MISEHSKSVADKSKRIYAERLQSDLEANHLNRFVAIEPESGDHFIADSFSEAVANARQAHSTRISFVIRVGHEADLHIGGFSN